MDDKSGVRVYGVDMSSGFMPMLTLLCLLEVEGNR